MKDQIRALKLNLKEIAKQLKEQKKLRKKAHPHHDKWKGNGNTYCLKDEYRHKHVAYCIARGRTLEQCDSGVGLDMKRVDWYIKAMSPESEEKLYIVVNKDLTSSQQAVQSAHAVAEFLRKNPHTLWSNGFLILLKDSPGYLGNMRTYSYQCEYAEFIEPDLDNKVTAYALFGPNAGFLTKGKILL